MAAFWALLVYFFAYLLANALNVPHHDGIFDFVQVLVNIENAASFQQAMSDWYTQYNDHRTSASRIQVYLAYLIEGELNFRTLTLLANVSLPLILFMLYLAAKEHPLRWVYLLSSALFLLHIRTFTIVLWSQPAFAYCYSFTYAFGCIFALHQVRPVRFFWGVLFCTLASLTLAAAQTVWVFGLVSLVHQSLFNDKRSWVYPIAWAGIAAVMMLAWHAGFTGVDHDNWKNFDPEVIKLVLPGLLIDPTFSEAATRYSGFFLVMLGSAFTDKSTYIAGAIGAILLCALIYISLVGLFRRDLRLTLCCWYVAASAAAVTYGRALVGTSDYILDSRYSFMSVLFVCTVAMLIQLNFKLFRGRAALAVTFLACLFSIWVYQHFDAPLQKMLDKRYAKFNKGHYEVFGYGMSDSNGVMQEAIDLGIYKPPCRPQPDCEETPTPNN
ncbi:MAG: hypothetical protein AB8B48_04295 [Pseudomonadales bacterium]